MLNDTDLELRLIPGYELLRPIGRGGMGVACLAKQLSLGRLVVIKFLARTPDVDPAEQAARFRREAELMASISHPNVTTIFDSGFEEGSPYLIMEYVEGGDLRSRMVPGEPLPVGRIRDLLRPLIRALECLHRNGILHRDLKPENILMDREDNPKVSDFGFAVSEAAIGSITRSGHSMGTVGYVSPEQHYRLPVDERADQYSLAALTYEMLTGQLPLGVFPPPSRRNRQVHPSVDAVILRALREDRNERYPTLRAFGDALDQALAVPRCRRRRLVWGASATLFLMASTFMVFESSRWKAAAPRPVGGPIAPSPREVRQVPQDSAARATPGNQVTAPTLPDKDKDKAPPPGAGKRADNPPPLARRIVNTLGMAFVLVPKGEFLMGSAADDPVAAPDEKSQHRVRFWKEFYLGEHEVTVGQFRAFVEATHYQTWAEKDEKGGFSFDKERKILVRKRGVSWRNPGLWKAQSEDEPVVQVCPSDAFTFCDWLTEQEGVRYRLPTEAEWEYACRAGSQSRWCMGDNPAHLVDFAWIGANAYYLTHPVGRKQPNAFGLYDMHGNVWEWCKDRYAPGYSPDPVDDPKGPPDGRDFVLRGGSWDHPEDTPTRSAQRLHQPPSFCYDTTGFRVRRAILPMDAAPRSP